MSRFAVDPRWLVYLPPTMSPHGDVRSRGLLEHPHEAFAAYRAASVGAGGVRGEAHGVTGDGRRLQGRRPLLPYASASSPISRAVSTRGRGVPSSTIRKPTTAFLERCAPRIGAAGLWDELETDWLVLDCELLPWSAKAEELLRRQYASVGAAGSRTLRAELDVIETTQRRAVSMSESLPSASPNVLR